MPLVIVSFSGDGLARHRNGRTQPDAEEHSTITMSVAMQLRKVPLGKEIVVTETAPEEEPNAPAPQQHIVLALARAFHWQQMLESGRYSSLTELGEALKVDRAYIRRTLGLAALAPDIVEAALRGELPATLTLEALMGELPPVWSDQRVALSIGA